MKIFFSILITSLSLFASPGKRGAFLKFMYKPSVKTIDEILIKNLEYNEFVNNKLIEIYLKAGKLKLAQYYAKKIKKLSMESGFIIHSELFLKLKKEDKAITLLKTALFDYNSEQAFYRLQTLKSEQHKNIKNFIEIIKKGIEINPYLINVYYSALLKNKNTNKKELFEQYLSYSDTLEISESDFKSINLNEQEKVYYLEKIIIKNNYKWAKKLYKKLLSQNPHLINLRRVLILNK